MILDDRLIEFDTWCLCGNKECVLSENFAENKKAILSDLLQIIGEDEKQPHPGNDESKCRFYRVGGKNFVRQELREKVKKYCE